MGWTVTFLCLNLYRMEMEVITTLLAVVGPAVGAFGWDEPFDGRSTPGQVAVNAGSWKHAREWDQPRENGSGRAGSSTAGFHG